jgi:type IV secretion system protein VirB10
MKLFRRLLRPAGLDGVEAVRGERGLPSVRQSVSLQARISNFLAMALMLAMGAAVLTGYYLHTARQRSQMRQQAQASAGNRAQTEMALPALGLVSASDAAEGGAAPIPLAPAATLADPAVTAGNSVGAPLLPNATPTYGAAPAPIPDRRLSGAAFAHAASAADGAAASVSQAQPAALGAAGAAAAATNAPAATAGMATLLRSEPSGAASARALSTQRLLLPKGAFIDCTLETAIDSTLPGMTTCVTASDTFGVDGKVVLLERGTKLVGETRGQVQQGTARVFVLWTEARTPTGVIVPLDSPGADELGRAGLAGTVERHFWERFGAALLISTIDGGIQAAVQSSNRGDGAVIYNPSATQDVATEVLKSTLNIAPTVRKDNGDRIQILVARDVDFTAVYELRGAGL